MCSASQQGLLGDTGRWKSLWPVCLESATRTPALEVEDQAQNACDCQNETPFIVSLPAPLHFDLESEMTWTGFRICHERRRNRLVFSKCLQQAQYIPHAYIGPFAPAIIHTTRVPPLSLLPLTL